PPPPPPPHPLRPPPRRRGGGAPPPPQLPAFSFDTLQNFLASQTPLQACYYCYGTSGQEIPAGVQLSKEELNSINTPPASTDN
ncbi:hypothetical protein, partial [Helicobacter japonicus]|uniref:hypothetical protein n=1 Tax=Helicobacter japonicus TaxID=425400 RepID=UPI0023F4E580